MSERQNAAARGWRERERERVRRQSRRTDFAGALLPITTLALGQSRANRGAASISPFLSRSALGRISTFRAACTCEPGGRESVTERGIESNVYTGGLLESGHRSNEPRCSRIPDLKSDR